MRLTVELIDNSISFINCVTERELDLRGHKISAIENLGAARENDAIDFTDNDIAHLANFPLFPRLRTLFLAQNRIQNIQANLSHVIPNLTTLVLTRNRIAQLSDLDPLAGFKNLVYLSLLGNPVANKENYRYWVIWRCPSVRFLDFDKVKEAERRKAAELFGTEEEPTELAKQILGTKSKGFVVPTFSNGADDAPQKKHILTEEERRKMILAIKSASSMEVIDSLEKDMAEGRVPKWVLDLPEPMET